MNILQHGPCSQGTMKTEARKLIRAEELQAGVHVCVLFGVFCVFALFQSGFIPNVCSKHQSLRRIVRGTDAGLLGPSEQESRGYVGEDVLAFVACLSMSACAWASGRRVLEGPVECVNPLKASGSLLLWRFQWISATA